METLIVNLDAQVKASKRYKAETAAGYFKNANLSWWENVSRGDQYKLQESIISDWLRDVKPRDVLELGAGFGRISHLLEQACSGKLSLVEINERAVKHLKREFPGARIIAADFTRNSWETGPVSLIVAVDVLVHVSDIPALMRRISMTLESGGKTIVSITPPEWYKEHNKRALVVDRGIDLEEFENAVLPLFQIWDCRASANGQLFTYLLRKRDHTD